MISKQRGVAVLPLEQRTEEELMFVTKEIILLIFMTKGFINVK